MNEVLYGIDYLEYYFYWIYYKFMGYPLIIRICTAVVMLCIFAYFCLLINIIYGIFKRKREKRKYAKIHKRYYEKLKEISLNTNHLTDEEIANIVEYNEKKRIKSNEIRIITQLLAEIKSMNSISKAYKTYFKLPAILSGNFSLGRKEAKSKP